MDIDVSKENIQPLRGGRNLVQLGTALQAQSDAEAQRQLQLQKEEHEAAIKNYQGTDPLEPWFNYIQWCEQSFPKHGHEGHVDKLIKECLQLFERDERYYQDRRFVKLWIKYIDCLSNPLEIYQRLYNSTIGTECSEFYRAWACYCEESSDYKKANQVYVLGLQAKAQPLDELEQAHMNFQLFFAQRMLHDDSPTKRKAASALAETRSALTSLKSFKRRNIAIAPVQRAGDSVKSTIPGVVRQGANFDNRFGKTNVMINVFEDAPSTSQTALPSVENPGPASLVQSCSNAENEKEIGIWTNAKTKMVHTNVVPHQPLAFVPYEDEDDAMKLPANHMPYCLDDLTFVIPLCVPNPEEPNKIPCYNKAQVYINDTEYSLEEIRSRKYKLERSKEMEQVHNTTLQQRQNSFHEKSNQSALETLANCALDAEQDQLAQLMPLNIPTLQHIKMTNMHSPGEPKVLVNMDSKELSQLAGKDSFTQSPKVNHVEKQNYENGAQFGGRNNLVEEFDKSLMSNLLGDSITVNTKEARWELRNLFMDNEPSIVQPLVPQYQVPTFDIHEDRSMTMAINTQKKPQDVQETRVAHDKENSAKAPNPQATAVQTVNKTAYYEEPSCTQVFNFNVKVASTPNMSQFKKPMQLDASSKIPKFSIDESAMESDDGFQKKEFSRPEARMEHTTVDNQGTGLSVIMEATREYNSKSGSSSSGQSTRNNFTGYTTPYCEKTQNSNYDSTYGNQNENMTKRNSLASQSQQKLPNGQVPRQALQQKREPEKATPQHQLQQQQHQMQQPQQQQIQQPMHQSPQQNAAPAYLSHDHQYQKPIPQNFNGFQPHQRPHPQFQQNYAYPQNYGSPPVAQVNYEAPAAYHSPQHPGFHSPPYAYQSPPAAFRHDYQYTQNEYAQQPQMPYHSPQHIEQHRQMLHQQHHAQMQQHSYQNNQYYPRPALPFQQQPQPYHHYASPEAFNASQQSPYRQPTAEPRQAPNFEVYQSPQASQHSFQQSPALKENQPMQTSPDVAKPRAIVSSKVSTPTSANKSTAAALRNVRHELNAKPQEMSFSSQFLNFMANRNEPNDNANTPKFTNSPNISQKMHKNLYVSSPEQAHMPPSSGMSDSDSKDGMTAQTNTPIQSAKVSQIIEKHKDISKRQLDFEHQSEDSRDSLGKEFRISSVYSRQSDLNSDGYGMDVDSENSMDCAAAYKSTHSISMVETSDIPKPADIDFPSEIDPFNKKILSSLLDYVKFPNKTHAEGYFEVKSVPKLQVSTNVTVGNNRFAVEKQLGKGNYGAVFLCLDKNSNKSVAVKYQKPSRPWEFYICQEIKARIKDPFMLPGYMDITTAYIADNASLFVSEYSKYGSLLDVANKVRVATAKCINESIVFLLTAEMLSIVHYLHKAQIIHADIKPDNFLLMKMPAEEWRTPSLQLIDLGCSIDMSLFPEDTSFRKLISTEGFTCTEMREGKPWTYQTDLYCLAGTIHVILMGSYMKVINRLGQWNIDKKLPRYMKVSLWDKIFTSLLNVPDCNTLPDLMDLKAEIENLLNNTEALGPQLRTFANVLKSR